MSFAVTAVVATAATVYSAYQSYQGVKAQEKAADQARVQAERQAVEADRAFNRVNQKRPNIAGIAAANRLAAQPSTMLTGAGGVSTSGTPLGSTSLLGS